MKRILIWLSVSLNVATFVGVWAVYSATNGFAFNAMQQERLRSFYETFLVEPGDIVFLGDSITEGGAWEEMFPGVPTKNRGIGGDTSQGVLHRLDTVTVGRPAKVFLEIGTNDLSAFVSAEDIAANVGQIIDTIHADSPGTKVYVQSVLPRDGFLTDDVQQLNQMLGPIVSAHGARWIDIFSLFVGPQGDSIRDDYANDRLHLMGPAYVVWRDALDPYVRE